MSIAPIMIDCVKCAEPIPGKKIQSMGMVLRRMGSIVYMDVCDRCGGSGRIPAYIFESRGGIYAGRKYSSGGITRGFAKKHRYDLQKWLEIQKELIYGPIERLE